MANINEILKQIKEAILGSEVRDSIHDGIQQCYIDAIGAGNTDMEVALARGPHDTLGDRLDSIEDQIEEQPDSIAGSDKYITYEQFGAVGDGVTDDAAAIKQAHEEANRLHLPVKGDGSKKYLLKKDLWIPIKTSTDWNGAELIFEEDGEYKVENPFEILPTRVEEIWIEDLSGITINQETKEIPKLAGYGMCLVDVTNANKKQYIRKGSNADGGYNQTDQFLIDNKGKVLSSITWDFAEITSICLFPADEEVIYVGDATIRTKEATSQDGADYIQRGIYCKRSNAVIYGINHIVEESGVAAPTPSRGILIFEQCANVILKDSVISSRRYANDLGTYEITCNKVVNMTLDNVTDKYMLDTTKWGCFTSNSLKNLTVTNCRLSRVDAHRGAWGVQIKDSVLGHQGIRLVGGNDLIVTNVTCHATNFISFRKDYGSSWRGKVIIRNVEHAPIVPDKTLGVLYFANDMDHDFGYKCVMPQSIEIENYYLRNSIPDTNEGKYKVLNYIEDNLNSQSEYAYKMRFPREIRLKNMRDAKKAGFMVWNGAIAPFYAESDFVYKETGDRKTDVTKDLVIKQNCLIEIDNVLLNKNVANNIYNARGLGRQGTDDYLNTTNRVLPQLIVNNCKDVHLDLLALPAILNISRSIVQSCNLVANGSRSVAHFESCLFEAHLEDTSIPCHRFNGITTDFVACRFEAPTYTSGSINTDSIMNAYSFLNYKNVASEDSDFYSLCNFANCRIHTDIHPMTLYPNLTAFDYNFNSSYGPKYKK